MPHYSRNRTKCTSKHDQPNMSGSVMGQWQWVQCIRADVYEVSLAYMPQYVRNRAKPKHKYCSAKHEKQAVDRGHYG